MAVATLLAGQTTTDRMALADMGFDLARLHALQERAQSREFRLQQMGFDVDRLRFYGWLVASGHNPEYGCTCPEPARATKTVSR
jgi:hypothetical protein